MRTRIEPSTADRWLRAVLAAVVAFSAAQVLTYEYGRDQGIFALVARTVLEGGMPYRDAFDFKPPGIFLLYALARALFGSAQVGIRVLEVVALAGNAALLVRLSQRFWGDRTAGWLAAALASLIHAQLDFWHTAQPETFGGALSLAAVAIATGGRGDPGWARCLAAGALFGMAGLLKPPFAGGGVVLALWLAWPHLRRDLRLAIRPVVAIALGGALPFAACLAWFAARGALEELYQTLFVFTPHYTRIGWKDRSFPSLLLKALSDWLTQYSVITTAGLAIALATPRRTFRPRGATLVAGIAAVQLLGVALQGKFFPYHYAGVWPFAALLAAVGLSRVWRIARARGPVAIGAFVAAACVMIALRTATKDVSESWWRRAATRTRVWLTGGSDREALDALATVADVSARGNRLVAEELARHVPAGRPIYIFGFEPVIYDLADRPTASRYIYNVPQRVAWAAEPARRELMRELASARPEAIVVATADVFPMVTGNAIGSADVLDTEMPPLRELLARDYRLLRRVDDFAIYLRVR